jgi:hypothetical protein
MAGCNCHRPLYQFVIILYDDRLSQQRPPSRPAPAPTLWPSYGRRPPQRRQPRSRAAAAAAAGVAAVAVAHPSHCHGESEPMACCRGGATTATYPAAAAVASLLLLLLLPPPPPPLPPLGCCFPLRRLLASGWSTQVGPAGREIHVSDRLGLPGRRLGQLAGREAARQRVEPERSTSRTDSQAAGPGRLQVGQQCWQAARRRELSSHHTSTPWRLPEMQGGGGLRLAPRAAQLPGTVCSAPRWCKERGGEREGKESRCRLRRRRRRHRPAAARPAVLLAPPA